MKNESGKQPATKYLLNVIIFYRSGFLTV